MHVASFFLSNGKGATSSKISWQAKILGYSQNHDPNPWRGCIVFLVTSILLLNSYFHLQLLHTCNMSPKKGGSIPWFFKCKLIVDKCLLRKKCPDLDCLQQIQQKLIYLGYTCKTNLGSDQEKYVYQRNAFSSATTI